jgi:hypothetical protein
MPLSQWREAMKQNNIDKIIEMYPDETFLIVSDMDEAIIGVDINTFRLVYSVEKIYEVLMKSMSREDAIDYFDYNILGAYMGDMTPIFVSLI